MLLQSNPRRGLALYTDRFFKAAMYPLFTRCWLR